MNKKLAGFAFVGLLGLNLGGLMDRVNTRFGGESGDANIHINTASTSGIGDKIKDTIRTDLKDLGQGARAWLKQVKVTAVATGTITVDNAGTGVTVNLLTNTQLRRRFWGKSLLSEISVGDTVDVIGKWTDTTKTTVNAVMVRDESIQKRFGVFFGTVKSLTSGGFVFTSIHRDDETVTFGTAKIVDRKGGTLGQADIKVGDKVRVRGMWDSNLKTITETVEVKDFSLPLKASPSASPVATPTP